jgi:hypothetical protein
MDATLIDSGALTMSSFLRHFFFRRILELTLLLFKVGLPGRYLNPVVAKLALLDGLNEPLEGGSEGSLKSTVPGWYDCYMSFKRSIQ